MRDQTSHRNGRIAISGLRASPSTIVSSLCSHCSPIAIIQSVVMYTCLVLLLSTLTLPSAWSSPLLSSAPPALLVSSGTRNSSSDILHCLRLNNQYSEFHPPVDHMLMTPSMQRSGAHHCPFLRPKIYHVPRTETTLKVVFGRALRLDDTASLLLQARDKIQSEIGASGRHTAIPAGANRRQVFHQEILQGDIYLNIQNLEGHTIDWGMLGDVVVGLLQLLVEAREQREVVFKFKSEDNVYRGAGSLVKG